MQLGGEQGQLCIPGEPGQEVVLGEVVGLPTDKAVTITGVTAVDAENATAEGAYILSTNVGAMYPDGIDPVAWESRQDAVGAEISGDYTSVVLVLSRVEAGPATARHMRITYTADGVSYEANGTTAYLIDDSCA
jgi:hypothetical protein